MFGQLTNRAKAYATVEVETSVLAASPHKLILMLFDGALQAIAAASVAMDTKDIPTKGASISRAIEIITNGLRASLDVEAGGDLAEQLATLYDYMTERLLYANMHNSRPVLDEVSVLLRELRDGWQEIGASPEATAA